MNPSSKFAEGNNPRSGSAQQFGAFASLDIGSPLLAGFATSTAGGWDITAGGADIWEKSDQFHFVFQEIAGDFEVAVRVESFTPARLYSKAGLMLRESLEADSAHLMFVLFADDQPRNNNLGAHELQFRGVAGGDCQAVYPAVRPPAPPEFPAALPNSWLRVTRQQDLFTASASTDGKNWKVYARQSLALAGTLKVGPALTSHHPESQARAAFRNYAASNQV